jgi:spore coat protein F
VNTQSSFMPDEDLLNTVLAELRRTAREYTTAATEANCPTVRQAFNDLTMDTLRIQGELYQQLKQMNGYSAPASALRYDVDKQMQSALQTQQKSQQFVQQKSSGNAPYTQAPNVSAHQPNVTNAFYM